MKIFRLKVHVNKVSARKDDIAYNVVMIPASLRRLFSVPRYLSLPAAGVDVSDKSVKFVELRKSVHGVRVHNHGLQGIPAGTVEKGKIINPQRLVDELTLVGKQLTTNFVNVALPEEQAYLFSTTVPRMKAESIRDSLSLQMERFVPIPLKDVIFDFDVVSVSNDSFFVQVVVIDRKTVYSYLDAFHKAGLQVVTFEIEPQSVARALFPEGYSKTAMIVDFGDTHTGLSVVKDGYVLFTTTSDITGSQYEKAIQQKLKVDQTEANRLKTVHGLLEHNETEGVLEDLQMITQILAKDLQKTIQYWRTQQVQTKSTNEVNISKLYFCGGNAHMPGLLPNLQDSVTIPIEKGDPWVRIRSTRNKYVPIIHPDVALSYSSAIGLAVAGLRK